MLAIFGESATLLAQQKKKIKKVKKTKRRNSMQTDGYTDHPELRPKTLSPTPSIITEITGNLGVKNDPLCNDLCSVVIGIS
jgi:hypothetical protein